MPLLTPQPHRRRLAQRHLAGVTPIPLHRNLPPEDLYVLNSLANFVVNFVANFVGHFVGHFVENFIGHFVEHFIAHFVDEPGPDIPFRSSRFLR
jgi:hypothetical protein